MSFCMEENMSYGRLRAMGYKVRAKIKHHYKRVRFKEKSTKDKVMNEIYNGFIKFNLLMDIDGHKYPTSITLKKNVVTLWLVMMEKIHCDHNREIIDFIEKVCMKRWQGNTAKGMSDFVLKCMIHSILEDEDWENYKVVYRSLNGRVHNPKKLSNTRHGDGHVKLDIKSSNSNDIEPIKICTKGCTLPTQKVPTKTDPTPTKKRPIKKRYIQYK